MNQERPPPPQAGQPRTRWARWAPRLAVAVLAADCTGGGVPPKPKADRVAPVVSSAPMPAPAALPDQAG